MVWEKPDTAPVGKLVLALAEIVGPQISTPGYVIAIKHDDWRSAPIDGHGRAVDLRVHHWTELPEKPKT